MREKSYFEIECLCGKKITSYNLKFKCPHCKREIRGEWPCLQVHYEPKPKREPVIKPEKLTAEEWDKGFHLFRLGSGIRQIAMELKANERLVSKAYEEWDRLEDEWLAGKFAEFDKRRGAAA